MNVSFWENQTWFTNIDFTIIGSGIVGLHTALRLREKHPNAKIIILEKGVLPEGASTKNAGFACFGSLSEIIDDLKTHTEEEVFNLIKKRWDGLQLLRKRLGDDVIDFKQYGGYELFLEDDTFSYEECVASMNKINTLLKPLFKSDVFTLKEDLFNFQKTKKQLIFNSFEAQIDTGKMMRALLKEAIKNDILLLNSQKVTAFSENETHVDIRLDGYSIKTNKLLITTNGFAGEFIEDDIKPARAQVVITKPIANLSIKGTFHLDKGYYYFRNIDNRVLLGGGRNLDIEGETTTEFNQTKKIQNKLEELLKEVILPHTKFEIDHRWSGIMGVGTQKKPIIKQLSTNVYCGVRLGGMGVAIGSLVGQELADLI